MHQKSIPGSPAVDGIAAAGSGLDLGPALPFAAELEALLVAPLDEGEHVERSEWLAPVTEWLGRHDEIPLPEGVAPLGGRAATRLWLLLRVLRRRQPVARKLGRVLRSILRETSAVHLLTATGLGTKSAFLSEALHRISHRLLPSAPNDRRLDDLVERLFPSKRDGDWLEALPPELVDAVLAELLPPGDGLEDPWATLRDDLADSVNLLATWVSGLGLQEDVRIRVGEGPVGRSPFSRLPRSCLRVTEEAGAQQLSAQARKLVLQECQDDVAACRRVMARVTEHLEQYGVSVDLVFRLDLMSRQLDRIEALLGLVPPAASQTRTADVLSLLARLVRASAGERSLHELVRDNARLLSQKVIESAGATGEHYIATTPREYRSLFFSASGGGLLTAVTTLVKYALATVALAPFFSGLAASLNYVASFLLLQALHFTLSSKQPATTAAALARSMERLATDEDVEKLVDQIALTSSSQLAAAVGNIALVIPASLGLDLLWRWVTGASFFGAEKAAYVVHSLNPLHSGTVFFAALTGVLLWLSSLAAGWLENWASFHRLPEAVARSRHVLRWLGEARRDRLAHSLRKHVAGVGGNVAIGFLLGMTPTFGRFFGLPLDIRHVTLSAGALTFAASSQGSSIPEGFAGAAAGIAVIGLLNFSVSFALAYLVAARACGVSYQDRRRVFRALLRDLVRSPGRFLLPPRNAAVTQ